MFTALTYAACDIDAQRQLATVPVLEIDAERGGKEFQGPMANRCPIEPGGGVVEGYVQNHGIFQHYAALVGLLVQAPLNHRGAPTCDVHHAEVGPKLISARGDHALACAIDALDRQRR